MTKVQRLLMGILLVDLFGGQLCAQMRPVESFVVDAKHLNLAVDAVTLNVLVTGKERRALTDLQKENFQVFENGIKQEITNFTSVNAPFSVALLLGMSVNTQDRAARIQDSVIEFLREIRPHDEVMAFAFGNFVYRQTDFTRNREVVERVVKDTGVRGWGTMIFDAVYLAMERMWPRPHRKVLVLLSDGMETSSRLSSKESLKIAQKGSVTFYTILFDSGLSEFQTPPIPVGTSPGLMGMYSFEFSAGLGAVHLRPLGKYRFRGRRYLKKLAEISGGRYFEAEKDLTNLPGIFGQIAQEMRSLYSLSYLSSNPRKDGRYRKIRVRVDQPIADVRTRKGYNAHKSDD